MIIDALLESPGKRMPVKVKLDETVWPIDPSHAPEQIEGTIVAAGITPAANLDDFPPTEFTLKLAGMNEIYECVLTGHGSSFSCKLS